MRLRVALLLTLCFGTAACFATREDLRVLQTGIEASRVEQARADSAVQTQLAIVSAALRAASDSMGTLGSRLSRVEGNVSKLQGDLRGDLYAMGQQLIQIQELTGQSQRRLQELRASLEQRAADAAAAAASPPASPPSSTTSAATGTTSAAAPATSSPAATPNGAAPGTPGPATLLQLSLDQYRRGSYGAARAGFEELLRQYPNSDLAGDALFYVAESYTAEGNAAAADTAYAGVVARFPNSTRAPTALFKRATAMQAKGDVAGARAALDLIIQKYPRSDEAVLARDRLRTLK